MLQRSKFAIASSKFASVATEEERERESERVEERSNARGNFNAL